MTDIRVESLTKKFSDKIVPVKEVSFSARKGEFVTLLGPSGCGKSTLLRMVAGLETVTSGKIFLSNDDVTDLEPAARDVAMVFQSYALYPHFSVFENIASPLRIAKVPKSEVKERVRKVAEQLGLESLLTRRPVKLSGGQRQRVALARALVRNPKVFLLDEPLSNLDALLREKVRRELREIFGKQESPILYVTHDQVEALSLSDRIVILNQGRIQQSGTPQEIYQSPANEFVAEFVGTPRMNLLETEMLSGKVTALKPHIGDKAVRVGIRPEDFFCEPAEGLVELKGQITGHEHLGGSYLVNLALEGKVEANVLYPQQPEGETLRVWLQPSKLHLFDSSGERIA